MREPKHPVPKLILDLGEYQEALNYYVSLDPKRITAATYCLGGTGAIGIFALCDSAKGHIQILVGLPRGIKRDSAKDYDEFIRLFPGIQFRFSRFHHAKCVIFWYREHVVTAIIGGRNLNFSASNDISYVLPAKDSEALLFGGFNEWWKHAELTANNCWKERLGR